ncbi:1-phosphofructokinase, partial [Glutamicibacter creatinolyticus]
ASGEALLQAARAGAVLKPNEHELREATGCSSLFQGARQLL